MTNSNSKNLRATTRLIKRYFVLFKKQFILVTIFSIISAIGAGTVPYLIGKFFDALTMPSNYTIFGYAVATYVAILVLWGIINLMTSYTDWRISVFSTELGYKTRFQYSSDVYNHLLELPVAFHKVNKWGEMESRITRAAYSLENIFSQVIINLAPQFISIIIAILLTLYIYWPLALVLIVSIAIYVAVALRKIIASGNLDGEGYQAWTDSYGYAYDIVQNVVAVKQAAAEKYEQEQISTRFKSSVFKIWMKIDSLWNNLRYYQRLIVVMCQIVIFIASIFLIHAGKITLGDLIAFNAYSAMMFGPFVTLMTNWQQVQNGILNIGRNDEFMSLTPEAYQPKDLIHMSDIQGNVEFKDVSFWYDAAKPILNNISFKVAQGQIVALVGESGVGKSTLIDLISALHFPSKGEILIDGNDIRRIDLTLLRSKIASVPQEVVLFNETIKTNILYGNFKATQEEMESAARKAHTLDFIMKFTDKWNQLVGERGVKLSVGQKQRVGIARAILRNPKILVLDEPTSALDAGSESIITQSLEELMKGLTTFIVAHRLSTVRHADMILVFKEGRIVESGTHVELLKLAGGEYKRLHDLQIGLHD